MLVLDLATPDTVEKGLLVLCEYVYKTEKIGGM